jgi:hypothetical protein
MAVILLTDETQLCFVASASLVKHITFLTTIGMLKIPKP